MDWPNWSSGDCVYPPGDEPAGLELEEILRRVATGFRRVVIDWPEGDRWVDARVARAIEIGWTGLLLEAEQALRGRSVLVSVADEPGPDATWLRFYTAFHPGLLELNYEPASGREAGRVLAVKLAAMLDYHFETEEESERDDSDDGEDA